VGGGCGLLVMFSGPPLAVVRVLRVVVVGGLVVCELDSGREHLHDISHHGVS
jgi:hypothetical protein